MTPTARQALRVVVLGRFSVELPPLAPRLAALSVVPLCCPALDQLPADLGDRDVLLTELEWLDGLAPDQREELAARARRAAGWIALGEDAASFAEQLAWQRAGVGHLLPRRLDAERLAVLVEDIHDRIDGPPLRVILVAAEDSALSCHGEVLRQAGMVVTTATNPSLVLGIVDEFMPDLLLTDIEMPGCRGPELLTAIRQRLAHEHLPALYLAALPGLDDLLSACPAAAADLLVEPVPPGLLRAAVQSRARRYRSQQRAEAAHLVQQARARFRLEQLQMAIDEHAIVSVTDATGNIVKVNNKFCAISGYRREELIGQNQRIIKSGTHAPEFYAAMWRTLGSGNIWHGELCNRRKDGDIYWVESTIVPFLHSGKPVQYISILTDITRIKRNEAALRSLVESTAPALGDKFLQASAAGLARAMGVRIAFIAECHGDGGPHVRTLAFWNGDHIDANITYDLPHTPCEQVLAAGFAFYPSGVAERFPQDAWLQEHRMESYAGVVLRDSRGHCLGHLCIIDDKPLPADWDGFPLLRLFAVRIAGEIERRRVEETLRATLESTQDGILVVDHGGRISLTNQRFRTMWRIPDAFMQQERDDRRMLATVQEQLADPDGFIAKVDAIYASAAESTDLLEFKDGRFFERHSEPLRDEGGRVGRVWSFHDITARMRAEQAAELHKERLRRGLLHANIGTWDWNIQTGQLYWSERIAPLFGYPAGELETSYENFIKALHPDDRQAVLAAVDASVERAAPYEIEHRVVWPDGQVRWLLERGAVVRDAADKPLHMLGVVQDIDDRKRAEERLALFRRIIDASNQFLSITDGEGRLIYQNRAHAAGLGYADAEIIGRSFTLLLPAEQTDSAATEIVGTLQSGDNWVGLLPIRRKDGSVFTSASNAGCVKDENGRIQYMFNIFSDFSAELARREELARAREVAERASRAKSEFLSSMSHELRTPMNAIIGFAQMLEYDEQLNADQLDNVHEILKGGRHLLELINEILDLAKIESGRIELSLEAVALACLAEDCRQLIQPLAAQRGIALRFEVAADAAVRADRVRLKQVLLNLLSNAVKYNRQEGWIRFGVQAAAGQRLRIEIADTGPGIPAERIEEIFQPFNRLDAEFSDIEGTGIGLTITRRLVEMMDGRIGVDSTPGAGSTFWIELPATAPVASAQPAAAPRDPGEETAAATHLVLSIDDNPVNLKLIAQILGMRRQIRLITAHTPELGIELALAHRPELILLDINMPGMNGYQLLEVLKASAALRNTPVLAVTANAMPSDIERGIAAGFADYITKPLAVATFLQTIDRHLAVGAPAHG